MKKIQLSLTASKEYSDLQSYWLQNESHGIALSFEGTLEKSFALLAVNPDIGEVVSRNNRIRKLVIHKNISLFYKYNKHSIIVLHIWHNARNPKKLNFK